MSEIPINQPELHTEAMKALLAISYQTNRIRAIVNKDIPTNLRDTIANSLKKTKTIINTTLKENDK